MDQDIKDELRTIVREIDFEVPMRTRTSFRVGGPAEALARPAGTEELSRLLRYLKGHEIPCFILGRGTNLLVLDGGIRGMVIDMNGLIRLEIQEEGSVISGAGVMLPKVVHFAAENSLEGMEFAAGIPGSVGGAVMMNAGAHGREMKDVLESVTFMTPGGDIYERKAADLQFSYRKLAVAPGEIVIEARFRLQKGEREAIKERMTALLRKRRETQPLDRPNAGCVFKNPAGNHVGRIIDEMGLKGLRSGGASVSEKHGNFIVNDGNATAGDILALVEEIKNRVHKEKGIDLETEIKIVGESAN